MSELPNIPEVNVDEKKEDSEYTEQKAGEANDSFDFAEADLAFGNDPQSEPDYDVAFGEDAGPNAGDVSNISEEDQQTIQDSLDSMLQRIRGQQQKQQDEGRPEHLGGAELKAAAESPINWMVEGLWTQKAKILLASEPKAGKSFLVCAMAMAVATGDLMFEENQGGGARCCRDHRCRRR